MRLLNEFMNKYLIRLDDACPTMDAAKWQRMEISSDELKFVRKI